MPNFTYSAYTAEGKTVDGELTAKDANGAAETLVSKGLVVLTLSERRPPRWIEKVGLLMPWRGLDQASLISFTNRLAMLLKGGLPLMRCLVNLQRTSNPKLRGPLEAVKNDVAGGRPLSVAMEKFPNHFPALLRALLLAGEASGAMVLVLKQFSGYATRQQDLRRKVKAAMTYPAIVTVVAFILTIFLSVRVVPTFAKIFDSFHMQLPLVTKLVVGFSAFLIQRWLPLLLAAVSAAVLLKAYLEMPEGKRSLAFLQTRVPLFKGIFMDAWSERLLSTFAMALKAGVSVVQAMCLLEEVFADNPIYHAGIRAAREDVVKGVAISSALRKAAFMDEVDVDSLESAEESGSLTEAMQLLADQHAETLDHTTRQLSTIIEPIMVVVIGAIVGVLMFAIFMPMIELTNIRTR